MNYRLYGERAHLPRVARPGEMYHLWLRTAIRVSCGWVRAARVGTFALERFQ